MSDDIFKKEKLLLDIVEAVHEDEKFIGRLINCIVDFHSEKEMESRKQANAFYLSFSLLASFVLKRKNIKFTAQEIDIIGCALPPVNNRDCLAVKEFHKKFNVHGVNDEKD
jgi:hypothetical protein